MNNDMGTNWPRSLVRLLLLGNILLAGCVNLQAVREFAKTSAATAEYRQILADYTGSPHRQQRYQPGRLSEQLSALDKARTEQKAGLERAQTILVQYLNALGDLASDALPHIDKEVDQLGSALEKARFVGVGDAAIKKETATATGTIAKILTKVFLEHWRRPQVRRMIRETDGSLQTVIAGLREIVLQDCNASLDVEAEVIRKYFEKSMAAALSRNDPDGVPPLARLLMLERLEEIEARRGRLSRYAEVLQTIGRGHADLARNVDRFHDMALRERLKQYADELQALYRAIREISR